MDKHCDKEIPKIPDNQLNSTPIRISYFTGWIISLHGDEALVEIISVPSNSQGKRQGTIEVPFTDFNEDPLPGDNIELWTWFEIVDGIEHRRKHYLLHPFKLSDEECIEWKRLLPGLKEVVGNS